MTKEATKVVELSDDEIFDQAVKGVGKATPTGKEDDDDNEEEDDPANDDDDDDDEEGLGVDDDERDKKDKDDEDEEEEEEDGKKAKKKTKELDIVSSDDKTFKGFAKTHLDADLDDDSPVALKKAFESKLTEAETRGFEKAKAQIVRKGLEDLPPDARFIVDAMRGNPEKSLKIDDILNVQNKWNPYFTMPFKELRIEYLTHIERNNPQVAAQIADKEIADGTDGVVLKQMHSFIRNLAKQDMDKLVADKKAAYQQYDDDKKAEDKRDKDALRAIIAKRTTYNGLPIKPAALQTILKKVENGEYTEKFLHDPNFVAELIFHYEFARNFIKEKVTNAEKNARKKTDEHFQGKLHNRDDKRTPKNTSGRNTMSRSGKKSFAGWDDHFGDGVKRKD